MDPNEWMNPIEYSETDNSASNNLPMSLLTRSITTPINATEASNYTMPFGDPENESIFGGSIGEVSDVSVAMVPMIVPQSNLIGDNSVTNTYCTPIAVKTRSVHRNSIDNEEFIPDSDLQKANRNRNLKHKPTKKRIRGHNLDPTIRRRIGELLTGFKNKYPHKSKKDIARMITKRISEEFPEAKIDIDIKGVLYNRKQNNWDGIPKDFQLDF